jgi:hypothetical protein
LSDFQREVLEYVKIYYKKIGKVPSISQIIKGVKNGSRTKIYDSFKGIEDICTQAGIPHPIDRLDKTKNLNKKSIKSSPIIVTNNNENNIKLTKDQILRINTISHLEKGKSQSKIIDNLLNLDALMRENGLDHDKIISVSKYIEDAKKRLMDPETLLNMEIMLHNSGYTYLSEEELRKLNDIAIYLNTAKLKAIEIILQYNRYIAIINIVNDYIDNKISFIEFKNRMNRI